MLIRMKFGQLVESTDHRSYVANWVIGKMFKVSGHKIRDLYLTRFAEIKKKKQPLMEKLTQAQKQVPRQNYGYRFLKHHQIKRIVSATTLRTQTAMSLVDRCSHFQREFPTAKMNTALLRQVYKIYNIKKRKNRMFKLPKDHDEAK